MLLPIEPSKTVPAMRRIRLRHHCGYKANFFMLRLGGIFLPLGYGAVAAAVIWFWLTDRRARRASRGFLSCVLRDRPRPVSWRDTLYHMNLYGKMLLDRSVSLADSRGRFKVSSATGDAWRRDLPREKGILLLTAHFGAAEMSAPMLKHIGQGRKAHFVVYRDMRDTTEHFHRDQWKSLADIDWINSTDPISAGIRVMKALKNADLVAIRADRPMQGRAIVADFFGRPMQLPAGPFMAALLSGASVITAFTVRTGYRAYQMHASMPRKYDLASGPGRDQLLKQAVKDYVADLERIVRLYPYQWGNFYDVWRTTAAGTGADPV